MDSDYMFYGCVFVLIILCAGQPDLLDAITGWVNRQQ